MLHRRARLIFKESIEKSRKKIDLNTIWLPRHTFPAFIPPPFLIIELRCLFECGRIECLMPSLVFRRESLARNLEISRKCPHSRTVLVDCYLESHKKMRLLPLIIALPCILAETQEASEYSSSCSDDGKLVIRIPYSNEKISDLLHFNAGSSSGSGESSENNLYHFQGWCGMLKPNFPYRVWRSNLYRALSWIVSIFLEKYRAFHVNFRV